MHLDTALQDVGHISGIVVADSSAIEGQAPIPDNYSIFEHWLGSVRQDSWESDTNIPVIAL
jgi:hypothetical protein